LDLATIAHNILYTKLYVVKADKRRNFVHISPIPRKSGSAACGRAAAGKTISGSSLPEET